MQSKRGDLFETIWRRLVATTPDVQADYRPGSLARIEVVTPLLKGGERLLDVGCGPGNLIKMTQGRYRRLFGCDLSFTAVSVASRANARFGNFTGLVCDVNAAHLPFRSNTFDTVTCVGVVEYVYSPRRLLRCFHEVLRPGGQAVLVMMNFRYWKYWVELVFKGRFPDLTNSDLERAGGMLQFFTRGDMVREVSNAGFSDVNLLPFATAIGSRGDRLSRRFPDSRFVAEFLSSAFCLSAVKG